MSLEICKAKIEVIEDRIVELKGKVDTFDTIKEVLIELKILTAQQIEANAQRDEMLQEHGVALTKAMETLKELDKKSDKHEVMLESLNKKGNVPLADIGKSILMMLVGAIVTAMLSKVIIK